MNGDRPEALQRWRLVLGEAAQDPLGGLSGEAAGMDAALNWLYGRDESLQERGVRREGGLGPSQLTTPDWLQSIHELFPKETIERLERDAVERYEIHEIVTDPDVLSRVEPNETILRAVLQTKHLMSPKVLAMARELVNRVVRQLMEKLAREVRTAFTGTRDRQRRSPVKSARNFDFQRTIRANLRRYDPKQQRLYIDKPQFFSRTKKHTERWQIILLVDQSGSMVGSVIHAAVTAACLWSLPGMRTHLIAFDTEVVDLTKDVTDPVELLMKVQLGGGTDIHKAVRYAADLVEYPRRTIVVVISDFFEGGDAHGLVWKVKELCEQGTTVLGLAALDEESNPIFDRDLATKLVEVGAHVGAMTPGKLAAWIAERIGA